MRVAAVDCGTNSLRLLVLERSSDGRILELDRRLELVRLGEGVDATGTFAPAALERMFRALDAYAARLAELGVERVRLIATSAARDVRNAEQFTDGVTARIGVRPEIITGAEEARLTFVGALAGIEGTAFPVLVTDIGGGSTELVVGDGPDRIGSAVSVDVGSVRLRERFLPDDPPTPAQLAAAGAYVDDHLGALDLAGVRSWIGVGGTATTMGALHLGLQRYDRVRVDGLRLDRRSIVAVTEHVTATPVDELVSDLLPPLRAQVIAAGAVICARISARLAVPMHVNERDLLDAVALQLLDS